MNFNTELACVSRGEYISISKDRDSTIFDKHPCLRDRTDLYIILQMGLGNRLGEEPREKNGSGRMEFFGSLVLWLLEGVEEDSIITHLCSKW